MIVTDYKVGITTDYRYQLSINPPAIGKRCRGGKQEVAFADLDCSLDAT